MVRANIFIFSLRLQLLARLNSEIEALRQEDADVEWLLRDALGISHDLWCISKIPEQMAEIGGGKLVRARNRNADPRQRRPTV